MIKNLNWGLTGTGDNTGFEEEQTVNNPFTQELENWLDSNEMETLTVGQTLSGTYLSETDKYYVVDAGTKSGILVEKSGTEDTVFTHLTTGSPVDVIVSSIIDNKKVFNVFASAYQAVVKKTYDFIVTSFNNRTVLTGTPIDYNHAGYSVQININGDEILLFMPHLVADVNKLPNAESILGQEIEFIIDSYTKDGTVTYVASRKGYLLTQTRKETQNLRKGELYEGVVINVTDFAVFVQFNTCLTCMIHKSNLNEYAQEMLASKSITNGMKIQFFVKDIMKNNIFATQVLRDSLWDTIKIGDTLSGNVVAIKEFGLLVSLDYETKGLLHKSILPEDRTFTTGETLEVRVTDMNKNKRQITLALN